MNRVALVAVVVLTGACLSSPSLRSPDSDGGSPTGDGSVDPDGGGTGGMDPDADTSSVDTMVEIVFVEASEDDAEETTAISKIDTNSISLDMMEDSPGSVNPHDWVGMIFRGVEVPQGAEIMSASVVFEVIETSSDTDTLHISGGADAIAEGFDEIPPSDRVKTEAVVDWAPTTWQAGISRPTADLSPIIQEITSAGSWTGSGPIAIFVTGDTGGYFAAASFDHETANAPRLNIVYQQ